MPEPLRNIDSLKVMATKFIAHEEELANAEKDLRKAKEVVMSAEHHRDFVRGHHNAAATMLHDKLHEHGHGVPEELTGGAEDGD